MKKNLLFVLFGATILLTMNACKSDEVSGLNLDKELKLSALSVEQQKAKIEQNGLDLVTAMDEMQDTKAMTTLMSMVEIDGAEPYTAPMQKLVSDIKNKRSNAMRNFDKQMRVSYVDSDVWGVYNYNFETKVLDKAENLVNKIIFNFPATDYATTNNAKITINYTPSTIELPGSDGEMFPSAISMVMTVDSKQVMTANFSGKYDANNLPQDVLYTMTMDAFNWTVQLKQSAKTVSELIELKKASTTLIKMETKVDGNFDIDQINQEIENETPENIFQGAVINMQMMDLAILGGTNNAKQLLTDMKAISKITDEKQYNQKLIDLLNKYVVCKAYFVSDNTKFADVELYLVEESESYEIMNWVTNEYQTITETYYYVRPRLILIDGSKVAVDTYIEEGFDDFLKSVDDMVDNLNEELN